MYCISLSTEAEIRNENQDVVYGSTVSFENISDSDSKTKMATFQRDSASTVPWQPASVRVRCACAVESQSGQYPAVSKLGQPPGAGSTAGLERNPQGTAGGEGANCPSSVAVAVAVAVAGLPGRLRTKEHCLTG
jgi:hypothetical protein